MNPSQPSLAHAALNGHASAVLPGRSPGSSRGRMWVVGIFALLGINFTVVGVTVYFALSDPSAAVEPDYYRKGLAWDETARQNEHNRALGWSADVRFEQAAAGQPAQLRVRLANKLNEPISGAKIECTYFANTNSGKRSTVTLSAFPSEPGVYAAPVDLDREGMWHVRLRAQTAVDVFTTDAEARATAQAGAKVVQP
ncbi:MAG: FixH family protein [Phycisphaerales bacterium]|nr:FixH family protein [Phycisphaerales bacterium]